MGVGGFEAIGRLASGYAGGGFVLGQSAVEAWLSRDGRGTLGAHLFLEC